MWYNFVMVNAEVTNQINKKVPEAKRLQGRKYRGTTLIDLYV